MYRALDFSDRWMKELELLMLTVRFGLTLVIFFSRRDAYRVTTPAMLAISPFSRINTRSPRSMVPGTRDKRRDRDSFD